MPTALDGIRTCISGIRAHCASDYTTTAGTPPVSPSKHFRHSIVSSIVKQSCMKHSNSYLRDRDVKHLQGPPDEARQRKTKDRADGMREKGDHCPRQDSNLYLWGTRQLCFRLHHDGRHACRQSKQTLQTLTRQLDRKPIMHETLQRSARPRRQASARTSAESDEACQRKTKDRADGMRGKSAHCPRQDSNLYLWDTCPLCFRLHHDGRHASRQSKQTFQTLNNQLDRETILHETLQLQYAGPRS